MNGGKGKGIVCKLQARRSKRLTNYLTNQNKIRGNLSPVRIKSGPARWLPYILKKVNVPRPRTHSGPAQDTHSYSGPTIGLQDAGTRVLLTCVKIHKP
ncbi:hypothetical protein KQX54_006966 [Cotesia glomerata]|uniref:Uncharacterized protein n=1 Tax=Cotesia glomerata TaxID=32391 RepID=A0AAV7IA60_COTGL|nr:hypothetical protein KQX54_006966 [Cotesia glomerata]